MDTRRSAFDRARELEIDCYYSSKGHYKASSRWDHVGLVLGVLSVLASAAAGVIAQTEHKSTTTALSFAVSAISAVLTFTKASQRASHHRNAGVKYASLRDRLKLFYTIDCSEEESIRVLKQALTKFVVEKHKTSEDSPHIPLWAYKMAVKERSKESFRKEQPPFDSASPSEQIDD